MSRSAKAFAAARASGTGRCCRALLAPSLVASSCVGTSCIVTAPAPDIPIRYEARVVRGSVIPRTNAVVRSWPADDVFVVPVEVTNALTVFQWRVFVDNADDPRWNPPNSDPRQSEPSAATGGLRVISFTLPVPFDPPNAPSCHTVDFVIAPFRPGVERLARNEDVVTWFYNPRGDLAGCGPGVSAAPQRLPSLDAVRAARGPREP